MRVAHIAQQLLRGQGAEGPRRGPQGRGGRPRCAALLRSAGAAGLHPGLDCMPTAPGPGQAEWHYRVKHACIILAAAALTMYPSSPHCVPQLLRLRAAKGAEREGRLRWRWGSDLAQSGSVCRAPATQGPGGSAGGWFHYRARSCPWASSAVLVPPCLPAAQSGRRGRRGWHDAGQAVLAAVPCPLT